MPTAMQPSDEAAQEASREYERNAIAQGSPDKRLAWIDGMRGACALYVVLHHVHQVCAASDPAFSATYPYAWTLAYGPQAVLAFLTLSGFCLMAGVQKDWGRGGKGFRSYGDFFKRRALRILPAYYGALGLCIALIRLRVLRPTPTFPGLTVTSLRSVVSHLFLFHDLVDHGAHIDQIDPPMWSMAIEWHVYFAFPLMIWIWLRFGPIWAFTTTAAFCASVVSQIPGIAPFQAFPIAFLVGAISYMIAYDDGVPWTLLRERIPWIAVPIAAYFLNSLFGNVAIVAFVFAPLLIMASSGRMIGQAFASPWLARVGRWSYSLYLLHLPIIVLVAQHMRMPGRLQFPLLCGLVLATSIPAAQLAYSLLERPFMGKR